MGSPGGPATVALSDRLLSEGQVFDFFQAVRLIERLAVERARRAEAEPDAVSTPVGEDGPPRREAARFRAAAGMNFAAASIQSIEKANGSKDAPAAGPAAAPALEQLRLVVNFLGLTGPHGALPHHYSTQVLAQRDEGGMQAFFDIFNHRVISLFYRAWQKYRFPIVFEQAQVRGRAKSHDPFAGDALGALLRCLAGFGTGGIAERTTISEKVLLYATSFAHHPRSAVALEQMASDYFQIPVRLRMFQGQWLYLSPGDRSCFGAAGKGGEGGSVNTQIGVSLVLGNRVWDVQSKFCVRLGPLTYAQFCQFMPGGAGLRPICELTRLYVGQEFDFEVQPVLLAAEVPKFKFGAGGGGAPGALGRNIWLSSGPPAADFDGAAFCCEN